MNDMHSHEKSALLAKALGWHPGQTRKQGNVVFATVKNQAGHVVGHQIHPVVLFEDGTTLHNLYDPANMALAKTVILWGYNFVPSFQKWLLKPGSAISILIGAGGFEFALDKILSLIIEAENAKEIT